MKYAIAAGHPGTAQAAEQILLAGGNAVDAAIAAAFASWVAEPLMTSAGGGGFAAVHLPSGKNFFLDFFVQTPRKKRPREEVLIRPLEVNFGDTTETFYVGPGTTAVPGFIDGLFTLHQRYGRMSMRDLVAPACQLAAEGVKLNPFQIYCIGLLDEMLREDENSLRLFYRDSRILREEDPLYMSRICSFLDALAREGRDFFYLGEPAQKLVQLQRETGGQIEFEDLASYRSIVRRPLFLKHRGFHIYTFPPPNNGGSLLGLLLHRMNELPPPPPQSHSAEHALWLLRCLNGIAELKHHPEQLLHALRANSLWGNTTHFSILDREGMAISLTSSNGEGSGTFLPDTDIQLNNMMGEPALLPKGLHTWAPDSRLTSMMTPTLVAHASPLESKSEPKTSPPTALHSALGSAGAGRIPFAIAQVLHFMLDYPSPLDKAVNAARTYFHQGIFELEPGFDHLPEERLPPTMELRIWTRKSLYFGGVNAVGRQKDGSYMAAADQRREGVSLCSSEAGA